MSEATSELKPEGAALQRRLGFTDLVAYGLAYIAPIAPLSTLGFVWAESNGLIALTYLVGGLCMLFTANSYAVMTREVRSAGSVYGFAREVLGDFVGFVGGWLILLDYLLIPAVVYVLIAVALSQLIPGVDRGVWIVLLVLTTFCINWFGVKTTSRVNIFSVIAQTAVVAIVLVAALVALFHGQGAGGLSIKPFYNPEQFSMTAIFAATSICIMSFLGFDAVSTLAEETKDPTGKTMGRAILTSLLAATALFVCTTWILGSLMQGLVVKDAAAGTYELTAQRIAPWVAILIAWTYAIVVGFTNALPMQVGVARMLFAMSRDRQLPAFMAKVHPKYGTPWVAMALASIVSCVVALIMRDHLDELASLVNFGALLGFLLLHLCVLVRFGLQKRSHNILLHWAAPLVGMVVVGAVLSGMSKLAIVLGAAWTLVGLVVGIWLAQRRNLSSSAVS
ncbi:APC family permease [Caulobacter sp. SL161]|uniref:APC family permease n=1 Tax=Caulobacter sp. SL161 TaxID=2995156 RepID=UPI0022742D1F|nr:APC family permease [Caulobacter sp. SL161]MCY1646615.1 APC family permease [Caulobacter sp. SL161]